MQEYNNFVTVCLYFVIFQQSVQRM